MWKSRSGKLGVWVASLTLAGTPGERTFLKEGKNHDWKQKKSGVKIIESYYKFTFIVASRCSRQFAFFWWSPLFDEVWKSKIEAVYKDTRSRLFAMPNFKFIDTLMVHCHPSEVLHCNYNEEISQKFDLVLTFDWRVLLTLRTTRLNYILQDFSRDTPLNHISSAQICILGHIWAHEKWTIEKWKIVVKTEKVKLLD